MQLKSYDPRKSSTRQFVPRQVIKTNEPDEKGVMVTSKNKVVENPVSTVHNISVQSWAKEGLTGWVNPTS